MLKIDDVTHWSIPVNDLAESERFYRDVLGLTYRGRLGNSGMACVSVGSHDILLCERRDKVRRTPEQDNRLHHSFTVSPDEWEKGACFLHAHGVAVQELIYREGGFSSEPDPRSCSAHRDAADRRPTLEQQLPAPPGVERAEEHTSPVPRTTSGPASVRPAVSIWRATVAPRLC